MQLNSKYSNFIRHGLQLLHLSFIVILFFSSCVNDMKDVRALPTNEKAPTQIGDSVTLVYTDSAKVKIILRANRMLVYSKNVIEPYTILPKGLFLTIFDKEEKISSTLKANYGLQFDQRKRIEVKYAVEVVNIKGEKLETEKLIWDEGNKRIYTDAFVKITTNKQIITGMGLESNLDFTHYTIKEMQGQIQLKDDGL